MKRKEFMEFFRDTEKLNTLSVEDRIEVFKSILSGSSDITVELLEELLSDYNVDNIEIYELKTRYFSLIMSDVPIHNELLEESFNSNTLIKITDKYPRKKMFEYFTTKWGFEYEKKDVIAFNWVSKIYNLNERKYEAFHEQFD